ncbi:LacI family transcriptional regulator [Ktedonosporobacter rubrisoli]|uniref:LacI family transcriptional regulator n=1 Tax=Ktedonosporobacter rubrisoli TaxID=2509675 RepID=A0A4P6K0E7_KTERU|nr:LacI family DNA-binding transcriptional regulator [Ktedonosporobacter rubrisoli]QBD81519.1 LacI family transcriptional regulator [Ktedonosporobacter rubrisoli]
MATIRDVALYAQVSASTVSHVINGTRFVDQGTRERVCAAIDALGYRPNALARSLRRGETNIIGLLVPDNANPFFAELAHVIEEAGFSRGYNLILCNSEASATKETSYMRVLLSRQIDGLILIPAGNYHGALEAASSEGLPVVIVDRGLSDWPVDQVSADNELGGYLAGQHLASLGHRCVGCISGPGEATSSSYRLKGFRRALQEGGIELSERAIIQADFRYASGEQAMARLLQELPGITAVFAANDLMALGAMNALRKACLSVPADISVIGFDDIFLAAAMYPALTTIAQPVKEMGQVSVSLLLERIKQRTSYTPARVVLPTTLIERESCRYIGNNGPGSQEA